MSHLVSEYVRSLDAVARSRYFFKLRYNQGFDVLPDPYSLVGWQNDPSLWPDLAFGDICIHVSD